MGNKLSTQKQQEIIESIYGNNVMVSIDIAGLESVDTISYLTVVGFIRQYSKNMKENVPYSVIFICLLFYFDKKNINTFVNKFKFNQSKNNLNAKTWKISPDCKTIQSFYNYPCAFFPAYANYYGYNAGTHYWAVKWIKGRGPNKLPIHDQILQKNDGYSDNNNNNNNNHSDHEHNNYNEDNDNNHHHMSNNDNDNHVHNHNNNNNNNNNKNNHNFSDRAPCFIGITSINNYTKVKSLRYDNDLFPSHGKQTFFCGYEHKPYWHLNETIIIKLDYNQSKVFFYKKKKNKNKSELFLTSNIERNIKYYFMLTADACAFHENQFSIVKCDKIL